MLAVKIILGTCTRTVRTVQKLVRTTERKLQMALLA